MDYDNLCRSILQMDYKIRFAGICDVSGEIKHGGQKEGVKNILSNEETRKSNLKALEGWGLRSPYLQKQEKENMQEQNMKKLKELRFH
jgi:hypothetical protein